MNLNIIMPNLQKRTKQQQQTNKQTKNKTKNRTWRIAVREGGVKRYHWIVYTKLTVGIIRLCDDVRAVDLLQVPYAVFY